MKLRFLLPATLSMLGCTSAWGSPSSDSLRLVAPALERYSQDKLIGEVWKRPQLSLRDRSIVTLAALIARNQTAELADHVALAIDHGVKPAEISEIITHLAFYAGRGNALAAAEITRQVFIQRKISPETLPLATPKLLPLDEANEAKRVDLVHQQFGGTSPGLEQYTTEVLFRDLWLRPDLAPRDRSLVTVCALIANGQVAQMPYHLNRAMDNGLTQTQAGEIIAHLAFYVGWPNAFSALPVAKDVFEQRTK